MTHTQRILDVISQSKDITHKEIIELIGDTPRISFSARLLDMLKNGLVTRKKIQSGGREVWGYTATGKVSAKQGRKTGSSVVSKATKPHKLTIGESQSELRIEVEELREWKRRAIIAFPELNVDPLLYKAREIFARHTDDEKLKDQIYSGKLDKRPPMLALVEVLENGT